MSSIAGGPDVRHRDSVGLLGDHRRLRDAIRAGQAATAQVTRRLGGADVRGGGFTTGASAGSDARWARPALQSIVRPWLGHQERRRVALKHAHPPPPPPPPPLSSPPPLGRIAAGPRSAVSASSRIPSSRLQKGNLLGLQISNVAVGDGIWYIFFFLFPGWDFVEGEKTMPISPLLHKPRLQTGLHQHRPWRGRCCPLSWRFVDVQYQNLRGGFPSSTTTGFLPLRGIDSNITIGIRDETPVRHRSPAEHGPPSRTRRGCLDSASLGRLGAYEACGKGGTRGRTKRARDRPKLKAHR